MALTGQLLSRQVRRGKDRGNEDRGKIIVRTLAVDVGFLVLSRKFVEDERKRPSPSCSIW